VFEPVKNEKLYKAVVNQVKSLIADGRLLPGDRLPPERELAQLLSVSRASVRQAVSAMEALGILVIKHGEGTFVSSEDTDVITSFSELLVSQQLTPTEILEARIVMECPVVRLCAERASGEELRTVENCLERNRRKRGDAPSLEAMNRDFHLSIAKGAHSRGLLRLMEGLYVMMETNLWPTLKVLNEQKQERIDLHLDQHEAIFARLRERDSRGAEELMRSHLLTIEHEFNEDAQKEIDEKQNAEG
jgi:GntR family transcriptional repressor for pyruvate dehydrogenase complex